MELPLFANLAFEFSSYAIAIVVFLKVLSEDRFQIFLLLVAIVATIAAEILGMRFSHGYYYSDFLIKIAGRAEGMPLWVALDWAVIMFCIWRLGARLDVPWYFLPFVCGYLTQGNSRVSVLICVAFRGFKGCVHCLVREIEEERFLESRSFKYLSA